MGNASSRRKTGDNRRKREKYTQSLDLGVGEVGTQVSQYFPMDKVIIPTKFKPAATSVDEQRLVDLKSKLSESFPRMGKIVQNDTQMTELVGLLVDIISVVLQRDLNFYFTNNGEPLRGVE